MATNLDNDRGRNTTQIIHQYALDNLAHTHEPHSTKTPRRTTLQSSNNNPSARTPTLQLRQSNGTEKPNQPSMAIEETQHLTTKPSVEPTSAMEEMTIVILNHEHCDGQITNTMVGSWRGPLHKATNKTREKGECRKKKRNFERV